MRAAGPQWLGRVRQICAGECIIGRDRLDDIDKDAIGIRRYKMTLPKGFIAQLQQDRKPVLQGFCVCSVNIHDLEVDQQARGTATPNLGNRIVITMKNCEVHVFITCQLKMDIPVGLEQGLDTELGDLKSCGASYI